jgi:hypothetical protein
MVFYGALGRDPVGIGGSRSQGGRWDGGMVGGVRGVVDRNGAAIVARGGEDVREHVPTCVLGGGLAGALLAQREL